MKRTALKRRTPLRKKSKSPISRLKKQLWLLCKEIIDKKHGTDCYTCDAKDLKGSNKQLGHYITSSVCSVEMRYDLSNLRNQCARCNLWKSGNWIEFGNHLERDGINTQELIKRNNETRGLQYSSLWYQNRIDMYETIAASLT